MRKQTKLVAALSATALLAVAGSAVAFAAGWTQENGSWQWIDRNGFAVTDTWKSSGNNWFYLDSNGEMAVDTIVEDNEDYYYVDANGAMVTNQWVKQANDDSDSDADYRWYYFGYNGKAYEGKDSGVYTADLKTINGKKYAFDEDGKMLYGWVKSDSADLTDDGDESTDWEESTYYFGDWNDGSLATGWKQIVVWDQRADDSNGEYKDYWFFFNNVGKKQKNKAKKNINGHSYMLDEYGAMKEDWGFASGSDVLYNGDAIDTVQNAAEGNLKVKYLNGDGAIRKNQWVRAVLDEDYCNKYNLDDYNDDELRWFWGNNDGKLEKSNRKSINGKYYIFDEYGRMKSDILVAENGGRTYVTNAFDSKDDFVDLEVDDFKFANVADYATDADFYFYSGDADTDGSRKTGYQYVGFDDGDAQLYLANNGKANTEYSSKINKFLANGVVLKANGEDGNYLAVKMPSTADSKSDFNKYEGETYAGMKKTYANGTVVDMGTKEITDKYILVNRSGSVQKNKKNLKDSIADYYIFTDDKGFVKYVSADKLKKCKSDATSKVYTDEKGQAWEIDD